LVDPPRFIMPPLLLLGVLRFIIPLPLFVPLPEVLALEQPVAASASAASHAATTITIRFWRITAPFDEEFIPGGGPRLMQAAGCSSNKRFRRMADTLEQ
jgi:hypothetical protein